MAVAQAVDLLLQLEHHPLTPNSHPDPKTLAIVSSRPTSARYASSRYPTHPSTLSQRPSACLQFPAPVALPASPSLRIGDEYSIPTRGGAQMAGTGALESAAVV
ncbi:uncharacterized protein FIBRA_08959 [Fibroporia radiculosa]|uniref:Uncharacterized protein n=1 Tax=Fibroporia radiculosa TaxID=599839 RepID=J4H5G0_9APHY|nr:uncharacterized protein FIBRA_08959 [Fibroporia radiculosa]CCM06674.1 predicted protein [Fibroporia radiculosa]